MHLNNYAKRTAMEADHLKDILQDAPPVLRLHNQVQHYDWGGGRYIPALLGIPSGSGATYAELWMPPPPPDDDPGGDTE